MDGLSNDPYDALDLETDNFSDQTLRPCKRRRHQTITEIPGPARQIQLAILRKSRDEHDKFLRGEDHVPVATQEYLNGVMRDQVGDFDQEFTREPWTWAMEFVQQKGLVDGDGMPVCTPLKSARRCSVMNKKIGSVVAIVQSCNPNGLGDLLVTLKDPTGTMSASVYHGVTSEGEFCRDISLGSVLILQKVAVFSPSRSASYLNIAADNVVKIINKDNRPPIKPKSNESVVGNLSNSSGCREKSFLLQVLPPSQRGTEGIMNNLIQMNKVIASANKESELEQGNSAPRISSQSNASSINQTAVEKESQRVSQDVISGIGLEIDNVDYDWDVLMNEIGNEGPSSRVCDSSGTSCVEALSNLQDKAIDHVKVKTQTLNPKGCLPEWTDEQLDELFASD